MPQQSIPLPQSQYRVDHDSQGRRRGWDWLAVQTDPLIDDSLKANASNLRYLAEIRFWREGDNPTDERIIIMHLEQSATGSLSTGEDLSQAYETNGTITITLSSGESITGYQSLSGDTSEQYRFDLGDGYTADEFDTFWNAMATSNFQQAGTLVIRDFEPTSFGVFQGRKLTGAAFGGRKLVGGAYGGRKFTI